MEKKQEPLAWSSLHAGGGGGANHLMTQSPREMLHSDAWRSAPSCTRLPLGDRIEKNTATARQNASRRRTFGLVGRRSEGAVLQPRCHDAGPTLRTSSSESSRAPPFAIMACHRCEALRWSRTRNRVQYSPKQTGHKVLPAYLRVQSTLPC